MLKVMIADDNLLTRQSLATTIPWERWGYTLIAEAQNGVEAYEKIVQLQPDIAILDINMPGLTGIEVMEKLNGEERKPVVLFLTAYDDFSYAQSGLKMGVFDYILKPADNEELKKSLDRAATKVQEERSRNPMTVSETDDHWIGSLLLEGVHGSVSASKRLQECMKERWNARGYELLNLQLPDSQAIPERVILERVLRENEKRENVKTVMVRFRESVLILAGFASIRFSKDYNLIALKLAGDLVAACEREELTAFIGISDFHERLEELPKMYEEVVFAVQSRFFLENKKIVHYKSIMSKSVHNEYVLSRTMQELFSVLNDHQEEFREKLQELVGLIRKDDRYNEDYVKNIITQVAFGISSYFYDQRNEVQQIKSFDTILREVGAIRGMQELIEWLEEYTLGMLAGMTEENPEVSSITKRALDYVNVHYMERIGLGDVAEELGISESYLCRVLKNDTGETFVNILNKIRVQKAQQLLKSGKYKVYEIAEIVGFSNYAYFFQVFKKITGSSPKSCQ